jgi:plasmid stabilization system protein ParE
VKIKFTPSARRQFLEGLDYIRRDSPAAARKFRDKVENVLRRLEEFPDSGRSIPEFPELPHREVIVPPYRFFYRNVRKTIWIVGVWHGAQLPEGPEK